uniref:Uncharacterized protein n=1 Tax=Arundo donax TaxID=35708 RepID=A0A0A9F7L8_ARUDO
MKSRIAVIAQKRLLSPLLLSVLTMHASQLLVVTYFHQQLQSA